ncbi:hypothetical protein [Nibricoccus sp. IMCC34717]|uniref:hypothetical protein n=1 Tax=Nibricoccus sp. IMCC34717 TaxID=3034021 RepID=UPI00384F36FB
MRLIAGAPLDKDLEGWIKITSPHFEVYAQNSESRARTILQKLEMVRQLLLDQQGVKETYKSELSFFVFDHQSSFERCVPESLLKKDPAGFFSALPDRARAVISPSVTWEWVNRVVFHEYVHYLSEASGLNLPLWLEEGLAEIYSSADFSTGQIDYAQLTVEEARFLNRLERLPLRRMMSVRHNSPEYSDRPLQHSFYLHSKMAVHYLLCDGKGLPEGAGQKLVGWLSENPGATAKETEAAFREIMKMSYEDFDRLVDRYRARGKFRFVRARIGGVPEPGTYVSTPVAASVMRLHLAQVRSLDGSEMKADPIIDEAALAGDIGALEFRGSLRYVAGDGTGAYQDWKQACANGSTNSSLRAKLETVLLFPYVNSFDLNKFILQPEAEEARTHLLSRQQADPGRSDVYEQLAALEAFSVKPMAANLQLVRKNFSHVKQRLETMTLLAVAYGKLGRAEDARTIIELVRKEGPDSDLERKITVLEGWLRVSLPAAK